MHIFTTSFLVTKTRRLRTDVYGSLKDLLSPGVQKQFLSGKIPLQDPLGVRCTRLDLNKVRTEFKAQHLITSTLERKNVVNDK